jgi:Plasma-membrane choline transporter
LIQGNELKVTTAPPGVELEQTLSVSMSSPYYATGYGGQAAPIVVQGHSVNPAKQGAPARFAAQTYDHGNHKSGLHASYGDAQSQGQAPRPQRQFRDVIWAVIFYVHLVGIACLTVTFGSTFSSDMMTNYNGGSRRRLMSSKLAMGLFDSFFYGENPLNGRSLQEEGDDAAADADADGNDGDTGDEVNPNWNVVSTTLLSSVVIALIFSTLSLAFMMGFAETLIRVSLIFNVVFFALVGALTLLAGGLAPGAMMFLLAVLSAYYACVVWKRVPFAASNLRTSISAVRANLGLAFFSYLSVVLTFGWSVWWGITTISTVYVTSGCDVDGNCEGTTGFLVLFGLLISYYWVIQVLSNVVHVTTAGTVGTWWFAPHEANGCCSSAVCKSYFRSVTFSFGSICLGSLIVALIQAVKEMVHSARENGDSALACCAECILGCIESLVEVSHCVRPGLSLPIVALVNVLNLWTSLR